MVGAAPSRSLRETFETVLVVGGFAVVFLLLPHQLFGDDYVRFDDIERLLHDGELTDSRYSIVMPLLSAPLLLVGEVVGSPESWASRFNVVVVAAGALSAAWVLRDRYDAALVRRVLLVLLFASLLTNRLRDYNAEVLTATLFAVGVLLVVTERHRAGWAAMVVGVVNTPAALVALAVLAAAESWRTRRLRHLLPIAASIGLVGVEAWVRRGSPFESGYEGDHGFETVLPYSGEPGFSYPLVLGIASILFSFGRGLLFFTPGLALWLSARTRQLARGQRRAIVLMLLAVAGLVLVYAKWWAWYGGIGWGPRFFVFAALPASLLIAVRLGRVGESGAADALTLLVFALSAWVGLSGAIADLSALSFCAENDFALESLCWYAPEFSSLWQPVLDVPHLTWRTGAFAAYWIVVVSYLAAPILGALARAAAKAGVDRAWMRGWRL